MPSVSTYDCIIIGAGPAGLTCAIFLGRYRRRVLVVDNGKPRNYASRGIHGFLGHRGIAPSELLRRGRAEAEEAGVEICECTATSVERIGDIFEVTTTAGVMRARRIALAYGLRDILPDIPRVHDFYGNGIYHCPDCDGYEVSDMQVGVIGWGKRVAGLALKLTQWTDKLTIFANGHDCEIDDVDMTKVRAAGIGVKDERIIDLLGTPDRFRAVVLDTGEHVPLDALFFTLGTEHSCNLAEKLGCVPSEGTVCLSVNDFKETTVEGVYAMGDLVPGAQLAITSAADGAIAAIAINKSLMEPGRIIT